MCEEANHWVPGKKIDEIVDCKVEGFLDAELSGTPSLHYIAPDASLESYAINVMQHRVG